MRGERTDVDVDTLGDRALVVAMRCGSAAAVHEFVMRFRPMLVLAARRMGLTEGRREGAARVRRGEGAAPPPPPPAVSPLRPPLPPGPWRSRPPPRVMPRLHL